MLRFKGIALVSVVCIAMATPLLAGAADKNPDAAFFKGAAQAGIAEIEAGKLAQEKGTSQSVKDYGAMMVKDHTDAAAKLKSIADAEGVDLPDTSGVKNMATKAKLEVLSGDSFDKSYIKGQVAAHRQAVALFRKEAASGQDAQAKAFAVATLPTLKAHQKKIDQIAAEAGLTSKAN